MGLGLSVGNGGGDFKPIVKYDARAGRLHKVDRVQGADPTVTEITPGFAAVFDLANIQVGWVNFQEGGAPDWAMTKVGQPLPARPSPQHKQGFRLDIKLGKSLGGDVRELASAAGCVINAMDALYEAYKASPEAAQGKLPVVGINGTTMVKAGSGAKTSTNYAPNFVIQSWVGRPLEFDTVPATAQPAASNGAAPPPVQVNHMPPTQQAPVANAMGEPEF